MTPKQFRMSATLGLTAIALSLLILTGCAGKAPASADSPDNKAKAEEAGRNSAAGQTEMYNKKMGQGK